MFNRLLPAVVAMMTLMAPAKADQWWPDESHSKAIFTVDYDGIAPVTGWFVVARGGVEYDGKNVDKAKVNIEIMTDTLYSACPPRDFHLKSENFFDIKKYPSMKFVSKQITSTGPGKFKMTGDLTIKNVTKTVTLECFGPKGPVTDHHKQTRIGFTGSTKFNRKDFGIAWNREVAKGVMMVGDNVDIRLEMQLILMKNLKKTG